MKFFEVSNLDHSSRRQKGDCSTLTGGPFAVLATFRISAKHHARISTGIVGLCFGDRAARLPEVPAASHAVVEAGVGIVRLRRSYVRVSEVWLRQHHGHIERSHDLGRAGLARQRIEAADLARTGLRARLTGTGSAFARSKHGTGHGGSIYVAYPT